MADFFWETSLEVAATAQAIANLAVLCNDHGYRLHIENEVRPWVYITCLTAGGVTRYPMCPLVEASIASQQRHFIEEMEHLSQEYLGKSLLKQEKRRK